MKCLSVDVVVPREMDDAVLFEVVDELVLVVRFHVQISVEIENDWLLSFDAHLNFSADNKEFLKKAN